MTVDRNIWKSLTPIQKAEIYKREGAIRTVGKVKRLKKPCTFCESKPIRGEDYVWRAGTVAHVVCNDDILRASANVDKHITKSAAKKLTRKNGQKSTPVPIEVVEAKVPIQHKEVPTEIQAVPVHGKQLPAVASNNGHVKSDTSIQITVTGVSENLIKSMALGIISGIQKG